MEGKAGHEMRDFAGHDGPWPEAHSLDGTPETKMPPDGGAQPTYRPEEEAGRTWHPYRAIGMSVPAGQDFGPYIDYLGEGLAHTFKLDFSTSLPFSAGGIHPHHGLLLFALALNLRPHAIIETGTFMGYSTLFLAKACEIWGQGTVYTIDPDEGMVSEEVKSHPHVEYIKGRSDDGTLTRLLAQLGEVDMVFLDSWKRLSLWEFMQVHPYVPENGIVAFHDTQWLDSGRTLYEATARMPGWEQMLFTGVPKKDNPHCYYGSADCRGLYVMRRSMARPFLDAPDANHGLFGRNQVAPRMSYVPIQVQREEPIPDVHE